MTLPTQTSDRQRQEETDLHLGQPIPRVFVGAATLAPGHGGIARVARMSARALIEAGHAVTMDSYLDDTPVTIGGATATPANGSKLAFAARVHQAALTHTHFLYDSAGMARAHPRLPGLRRPYAVWMHGIEVWHGLRPVAHRAVRRADLRLVNSEFTLRRFREIHGDMSEAHVCWLATEDDDPPPFKPSFAEHPTAMILARVDGSEGYKGHAELVAAWPEVVSAVPEARLLIVGGGPALDNLKSIARASSVACKIEFTGFVPEQAMPALWQRAHLLAMPGRNEGFGLVYVEAMRHGLPVIASVHDAGQEVNVDGVTGFNVDLGRKGELASRLIALLGDPDLAARMGEAGHRRWREHFCFSAFERRLAPILRTFLSDAS